MKYKYYRVTGGWQNFAPDAFNDMGNIYRHGVGKNYVERWERLAGNNTWVATDAPIFDEMIEVPEKEVFMKML